MGKLNEFITYLNNAVDKHIYIWGGQGTLITSEDQIRKYETSTTNANRAIKLYNKRKTEGVNPIIADDCSGLGVAFLLPNKLIPSDRSANGLMAYCDMIDKSTLRKGCFVFRVYKSGSNKGRAYHIGYVVDDELNVVESKGRDDGVVKRSLNASGSSYWNAFGIPSFFVDEINGNISIPNSDVYTRPLKLASPYMRGEDVKVVQKALNESGYPCGDVDGVFGSNTENAVIAFQKANGLSQDGIVGQSTWNALMSEDISVSYSAHVQNIGWMEQKNDGEISGTTGESLRMEAIKIDVKGFANAIEYCAHVQNIGWQNWVGQNEVAGTTGQSLRLEALKIRLKDSLVKDYDILYRTHVQNVGWQNWVKNGEQAGTTGQSLRAEAIQIKIVKK